MFEALSEQFESAWKKLRGQDKISEANITEALREVRRALLEADAPVSFQFKRFADSGSLRVDHSKLDLEWGVSVEGGDESGVTLLRERASR